MPHSLSRYVALILPLLPLLGGCASRRPLELRYSMLPTGVPDTSRALTVTGEMAKGLDVSIDDRRADTSAPWIASAGSSSNGAAIWVIDAIRYELWSAGFRGGSEPSQRLVVRGSIDTIELERAVTGPLLDGMRSRGNGAFVSLYLRVTRDTVVVLAGRYRAGGSNAADRSSEVTAVLALDMALANALATLVRDMRELSK